MDRILADVGHAWRVLRLRPISSVGAILLVSLGIGSPTATLAVSDAFLLRGLPYVHADRLVVIEVPIDLEDVASNSETAAGVTAWRARTDLFTGVAAFRNGRMLRVRSRGAVVTLTTAEVTSGFFEIINADPDLDTLLSNVGCQRSMLVTRAALERLPSVNGELRGAVLSVVGGGSVCIAGILSSAFVFPSNRAAFPFEAILLGERHTELRAAPPEYRVVARLAPGVTPLAATAALRQSMSSGGAPGPSVESLDWYLKRGQRPFALGALAAAALILLMCAANLVNLMGAKTFMRAAEYATRQSLGASNRDLLRLHLIESTMLCVAGLLGGLAFARVSLHWAMSSLPPECLLLGEPRLSVRIVLAAAIVSVLMVASCVLAICSARRATGGSRLRPSRGRPAWLRRVMMSAQCAFGMLLLVSAVLLLRSFARLTGQDTGYASDARLVTVSYPDELMGAPLKSQIDATVAALRRVRGVTASGALVGAMLDRYVFVGAVWVNGRSVPANPKDVSGDYFRAIGNRVVAGRPFNASDSRRSAVVVNESLAQRCWPRSTAVGRFLDDGAQVVGVVSDSFDLALDRPSYPTVFRLDEDPQGCSNDCNRVTYVVKSEEESELRRTAAVVVSRVSPDASVLAVDSVSARLRESVRYRIFATLVLTLFACTALAICCAGVVAIVAFLVSCRTREIAIRIAVGAQPMHVLWFVMGEACTGAAFGTAAGLWAAIAASRMLQHLVFGIETTDWPSRLLSAAMLLGLTATASYLAGVRATSIHPSLALRND